MKKQMKNFLNVIAASTVGLLVSGWALADGPAVAGAAPAAVPAPTGMLAQAQQPGGLMSFAPFILMFGVVYFLMIRPQQKKAKEVQEMINALKHGDEVVTTSGMLGKVTGIADRVVTLEVASDVRIKMLKSQVAQVVKGNIKDLAQA